MASAIKNLGELITSLDTQCKEIDENYVGLDKLIPTTSWVDLMGRSWRIIEPSPLNDAHMIFLLCPQEDGHLSVYCYPGAEKDKMGRPVKYTRYRFYEPSTGVAAGHRLNVQVETMDFENWQAELVEELLDLNDDIVERDAARAGRDDEMPPDDGDDDTAPTPPKPAAVASPS